MPDDTAIYKESRFVKTIQRRLKKGFLKIQKHFSKWKIKINYDKTTAIFFTRRNTKQLVAQSINLANNIYIPWSKHQKYLGLTFTPNARYDAHIESKLDKVDTIIRMLYPIICRVSHTPTKTKLLIYKVNTSKTYPHIRTPDYYPK